MIVPILFMVIGILVVIMTYIDGKNRNAELTTSYIMHLKGYIGGMGLFLIGLFMMLNDE
jgi:hypothetical protein